MGDVDHYLKNQDFYMIAEHLMDLKYLGAPLKSIQGQYAYVFMGQHPCWIGFFKEMRAYLNHPAPGLNDTIQLALEVGDMSPRTRQYLEGLYK